MGKEKTKEMLFWTKPEYLSFSQAMMDKPVSYYAFETLYWCGERGSAEEHLTVTQFKVQQEAARLEALEAQVEKKEQQLQKIEQKTKIKKAQAATFDEIDSIGRKTFTGKLELSAQEGDRLKELAKRGIAITEVYTHNTELKKRLLDYAARFPYLCQQTDDNGQGGLRFEIAKERISIRLTAPYSKERRDAASKLAKKTNTFKKDM